MTPAEWEKQRNIRIPDREWDPAAERAAEQGETMTDVVRRAVRNYAADEEGPESIIMDAIRQALKRAEKS